LAIHHPSPPVDSLVLYKVRPARVISVGEKLEIALEGGQTKRVRPKDVQLLHPGPLRSLDVLAPLDAELDEAWELLEGGETNLQDLCELAFGDFTPQSAWAAWQRVHEGLQFSGDPSTILARPREEVERERAQREAKAAAERDWNGFIARMEAAAPAPEDDARLGEVERLASGRSERSRVLQALGQEQTPENAHRMLNRIGFWAARHNPHPARCGVAALDPVSAVPPLPEEDRLDLTALPAYAIDDEGNEDPDDAVSLDGDRLWVHVADVAALVGRDGEIEREARARGANLYAPEGIVNMLPAAVTDCLGLGLQEVSPALSVGLLRDDTGGISDVRVERTWIRATRLTYGEVEKRLSEAPYARLLEVAEGFRALRNGRGATSLDLPEVSVRVVDGEVRIRPIERLRSRALVTEAMLMAGEGVARFCLEREIPIPFATQAMPDPTGGDGGLAADYARRRTFKPTRLLGSPDLHAGLGLERYTRATSPLRRYSDLLVHQQLRAWLAGEQPLGAEQVTERIAEAELAVASIRRAERLSNLHWKLVYLTEHPGWKGDAVVVVRDERAYTLLVPELALEARVRRKQDAPLNARLRVSARDIDIPGQSVRLRVLG
jgi:exoribonuclease II